MLRHTTYPDAQSDISFKSHGVCIWDHNAGQNLIDSSPHPLILRLKNDEVVCPGYTASDSGPYSDIVGNGTEVTK